MRLSETFFAFSDFTDFSEKQEKKKKEITFDCCDSNYIEISFQPSPRIQQHNESVLYRLNY